MKAKRLAVLLLLTVATVAVQAQWMPEPTHRLVNDYSGVLTESQRLSLEQRLVAFNDSTSNQVLLVVTPTLGGDDENAVAQRIGQQWGVGQESFNNGVVILVKSKTADENWGAVAIATGYGVEGAMPDLFCKRIIDDHMLPPLGEGDYYRAFCNALDIIEPVLAGEYSYAQYCKDEERTGMIALGVFALVIVVILVLVHHDAKRHPDRWKGGGTGTGGFYYGGAGSSFHGSDRSSGSFGGFGGFGGGSFGGGGASGRF